jgi:glycosyltransferase involved in cell wall biosynthesis
MSKIVRLSVVINTHNAAATLERALQSVKGWSDEVIIADMGSTDSTTAIATAAGARVMTLRETFAYVEPARNRAVGMAKGEWVFVLDADEEVMDGLRERILQIVYSQPDPKKATRDPLVADAYYIARSNNVFGHEMRHTGWWPDYQLRLFRKGHVTWSDVIHAQPNVQGKVAYLPANECVIYHHNYQTVEQFVERLNRYTTVQALGETTELEPSTSLIRTFWGEWARRLFQHNGFDDGVHGVGLALLQAMYELVVLLKRYQKASWADVSVADRAELELQALMQLSKDMKYWRADYHLKHARNVGVACVWWVRRKLRM